MAVSAPRARFYGASAPATTAPAVGAVAACVLLAPANSTAAARAARRTATRRRHSHHPPATPPAPATHHPPATPPAPRGSGRGPVGFRSGALGCQPPFRRLGGVLGVAVSWFFLLKFRVLKCVKSWQLVLPCPAFFVSL